jgi:hypothetical protein
MSILKGASMRNLIDRFIISRFERDDGQDLLASLRSLSIHGRAEAKAATWVTAASLLAFEKSAGETQFARVLGHLIKESVAITGDDRQALSSYCDALVDRRRKALDRKTALMQLIATGIPVWIASIRALLQPALVPLAIDIWDIVGNGDDALAQRNIDLVLSGLKPDTDLAESITRMRRKPLTPAFGRPPAGDASDLVMANGGA